MEIVITQFQQMMDYLTIERWVPILGRACAILLQANCLPCWITIVCRVPHCKYQFFGQTNAYQFHLCHWYKVNQSVHAHWAGRGLKKNFELKRRILFSFVEHTSVIKKNFKTENLNGGFLRKLKKSPKIWPFLRF